MTRMNEYINRRLKCQKSGKVNYSKTGAGRISNEDLEDVHFIVEESQSNYTSKAYTIF